MKATENDQPDTWSAEQYSKFEQERNRPVVDLLAQVPLKRAAYVIDIGCGPGNSTQLLQYKFPAAHIGGIDSSAGMISAARLRLPAASFAVTAIENWVTGRKYDVILANASLQWVGDHEHIFPSLIEKLGPGGCLAVQMPDNQDEPAHRLMRKVAQAGSWATKLQQAPGRLRRHEAAWYYQLLLNRASHVNIWRTTYYHQLAAGPPAIVEWFKGTGLRPYLDPLDDGEKEEFLLRYTSEIEQAYPAMPGGGVLLPFPRLFLVATR